MSRAIKNNWVAVALTFVGSLVYPFLQYRIWSWPLGVPFSYRNDSLVELANIKHILENGFSFSDIRLGAPFGQEIYSRLQEGLLTNITVRFLGWFSDNPAAIFNVVFLFSYPAVAIAAWAVFRYLKINTWLSSGLAIVFANLPYHIGRIGELSLANYFVVPFAIWLVVILLSGKPPFTSRSHGRKIFKWLTFSNSAVVMSSILIPLSDLYFGVLTALLLVAALGVMVANGMGRQKILQCMGPIVLVVASIVFIKLPQLFYQRDFSASSYDAFKSQNDVFRWGLEGFQLVLPQFFHRVNFVEDATATVTKEFASRTEYIPLALGFLASAGFLFLLAFGFATLHKGVRGSSEETTIKHLVFVTIISLLFATVGGISVFFTYYIDPTLNRWNRVSVFIAFCSLAAVGIVLQRLDRRFTGRFIGFRSRVIRVAIVLILVTGAVADQTSDKASIYFMLADGRADKQSWQASADRLAYVWNTDSQFFGDIENRLDKKSKVFQIPNSAYIPSFRNYEVESYDSLVPYIHTNSIRWSYGAQSEDPKSKWTSRLSDVNDPDKFLFDVAAAGFDGIYIDKGKLIETGDATIASMKKLISEEPLVSGFGDQLFFDLREYKEKLKNDDLAFFEKRSKELLLPAFVGKDKGFYPRERIDENGEQLLWSNQESSELYVENITDSDIRVKISFVIGTASSEDSTAVVFWPDGFVEPYKVKQARVSVERELTISPGVHDFQITTTAACQLQDDVSKYCHFVKGEAVEVAS